MDRYYLMDMIRRIKHQRDRHDEQFAANPAHKDCLPRFGTVLANLEKELSSLPDTAECGDATAQD
jgi:hypothetical protein